MSPVGTESGLLAGAGTRVAAFVLLLGVAGGASYALGQAVGPLDLGDPAPHRTDDDHGTGGDHG